MVLSKEEKEYLYNNIRDIEDFPKKGIIFKDITTLLNDAKAFSTLMQHLKNRYETYNLDYIAGIDSRGFIFGATLAQMLGVGFVPIRKKGKLPATTYAKNYELEYGEDTIEIHQDAFHNIENANVLLIDDLIATGGTAFAAAELIKSTKANCVEACFLMELKFLDGSKNLKKLTNVYSVLEID